MPPLVCQLDAGEAEPLLPGLIELLLDTVNGGVPLGFLPPVSPAEAERYWRGVLPDLERGTRVLLVAFQDDGLVGTGQLSLTQVPNAPHRAELQKLLVANHARGQGVGRRLMEALHDSALAAGRTLVILNTRRGLPAVEFYRAMGYEQTGVIPGFTVGRSGERFDTVIMYRHLEPACR